MVENQKESLRVLKDVGKRYKSNLVKEKRLNENIKMNKVTSYLPEQIMSWVELIVFSVYRHFTWRKNTTFVMAGHIMIVWQKKKRFILFAKINLFQ